MFTMSVNHLQAKCSKPVVHIPMETDLTALLNISRSYETRRTLRRLKTGVADMVLQESGYKAINGDEKIRKSLENRKHFHSGLLHSEISKPKLI